MPEPMTTAVVAGGVVFTGHLIAEASKAGGINSEVIQRAAENTIRDAGKLAAGVIIGSSVASNSVDDERA